jgi:hypothetical protein
VEEEKTNFKPDGAPIRAKVSTTSGDSETQAERRVSERLRHKDRTASDPDAYGRIKVQFAALNRKIDAELERIHEPGFAVRAEEETGIRFGDGRRGARLPSGKKEPDSSGSSANVDARAIADSRNKLAVLQREYAALERQVDSLERR